MFRKNCILTLVVCLCAGGWLCLAQNQPSSQGAPGTFSGRLSGAGMDGATVTVTNTVTNAVQTAVTDNDGAFTISNLVPGLYRIGVRLRSGMQLRENTVEVNSSGGSQLQVTFIQANIAPIGPLEIQAESPTLQTDTAEVSRSYDSVTIRELPILDRQNQELVTLMPGITPPVRAADRITDPQRTRAFNVNGQPSYVNLNNQDGAYDTEPFSGRPLRVAPDESVQALDVRTSNYNAEYGVAGGSWASTVTRPGTNAIHGSLFEFNTNNFFHAGRTFTQSKSTPGFTTNQFGATVGGPVIPDKVFWFLSYEGYIQRGSQEAVATVPGSAFANGNFSQVPGVVIFTPLTGAQPGAPRVPFPNNVIPPTLLDRNSQQILSLLPTPNVPGFTNNLVGSVRQLDDTHRIDGKVDHRFSERSTGFFRYGFTQASINQGSLLGAEGNPTNAEYRGTNGVASISEVFKTSLLGEFRFAYDRYRNQIAPYGNFSSLSGLTGFPNGLPSITLSGFTPLGFGSNVPSKQVDNVYEGTSNWVAHWGINSIKFGADVRELQVNGITNQFFSRSGSFVFGPGATLGSAASAASLTPATLQTNSLAGFLLGAPTQAGVATPTLEPGFRQRQYSAYLSDAVNLFQKVYLELGVRYDIFSPVDASNAGSSVTFNPATNTVTPVGLNGGSLHTSRYDLNNLAPRVGIAFHPIQRLVFRAGYGIHYFPTPLSLLPVNFVNQSVQVGAAAALPTTNFTIPTVPAASPFGVAPNTPLFTSPRDLHAPYLQTYSAMVQGDLGNGFLLDLGYIGNLGRELPMDVVQAGLPGTGFSGLYPGRTAATILATQGTTSNYNSTQVNLTKKFAGGLALASAYTYGKALDYGFNALNPYNRRSNYGPADWDRTHILSVSHVWRLPFGVHSKYFTTGLAARILGDWELNGILRWATGTPYTVTADPIACQCLGVAGVPANFLGSGKIDGSSTFNTSQFATPPAGTFGNLSRNALRGPDFFVYNAALFKNFAVNESIRVELRGEVYNLTNTSNPVNPVSTMNAAGFGTSLGTVGGLGGRQLQVAARILF